MPRRHSMANTGARHAGASVREAVTVTLIRRTSRGAAGTGVALAGGPVSQSSAGPVRVDSGEALEGAESERIRAMALVAAQETLRLQKAHVAEPSIKAIRVVYRDEVTIVLPARSAPYTPR